MTAERLLGAVGDIRDEYVREAGITSTSVKKYGWVKWVAAAACVVVAALIAAPWLQVIFGGATGSNPSATNAVDGPSGRLVNSGTSIIGANARMPYERDYLYTSYNELSQDYVDPVFEAFEKSDFARQHKVTFGLVYSAKPANDTNVWDEIVWGDEYLVEARVAVDAPSSDFYGEDVPAGIVRYVNNETDVRQRENEYSEAEYYGTRTDYTVDGVEVQKYEYFQTSEVMFEDLLGENMLSDLSSSATHPHTSYNERVSINGEWYYVYSTDEGLADALATALAHIAAGN